MNVDPGGADCDDLPLVDAVVTWVDGGDPEHAQKRRRALQAGGGQAPATIPAGLAETRFEDNGELRYCLYSIRKFAPWIRTIHLVTDRQVPTFLTEEARLSLGVSIVDHQAIFQGHEDVLPTFNSLSIETVIHRIPGLASKHVYFNDDFILLAPTRVEDFFVRDGVVLRGTWHRLQSFGPVRLVASRLLNRVLKRFLGINRAMSVLQQIRGAQLAGFGSKFFKVGHSPYPMRKETLQAFFSNHEQTFLANIAYRFRNLGQFATTSLANHLEIRGGTAKLVAPDDCLMVCFNRDGRRLISRKIRAIANETVRFLCIQSLEEALPRDKDALGAVLRARILGP